VISLKKYLDMEIGIDVGKDKEADKHKHGKDDDDKDRPVKGDFDQSDLFSTTLACYRSVLRTMGKSAHQACPEVSSELQQNFISLEKRLSGKLTPLLLKESEQQVGEQLQQWGGRIAEYFNTKANDVKELLIVLARTAESVGQRDQHYEQQLGLFTNRLQSIANLDDLTKVRLSLIQSASELKTCVDKMAQENRETVAELQAQVKTYESKLMAVEQIAARDALTGLATRRYVEERIELRIQQKQVFCVAIVDLNRLKQLNDTHGHLAGDNLLKQFSQELRSNSRPSDLVGRWGGDEFILVLDCDLPGAQSLMDRILKWVFGEYTIQLGEQGEIKIMVDASVGVAEWKPGETIQQVVARADAAMYKEKAMAHKQRS